MSSLLPCADTELASDEAIEEAEAAIEAAVDAGADGALAAAIGSEAKGGGEECEPLAAEGEEGSAAPEGEATPEAVAEVEGETSEKICTVEEATLDRAIKVDVELKESEFTTAS